MIAHISTNKQSQIMFSKTLGRATRLFLILGSILASATALGGEKRPYQPKYQTIAHEILALESEIEGMTPNYELLDVIIDDVQRSLTIQPPYSQADARMIFQFIATVLRQKNFQIGDAILLTEACTPRNLNGKQGYIADCDALAFLYLGIGEALNLPLRLVAIPEHAFVRWHFTEDTYLNWESTIMDVQPDEKYMSWYDAGDRLQIPARLPPKSLHRAEVFAIVYENRGYAWQLKGEYANARADYTKAMEINPHNADVHNALAWFLATCPDKRYRDGTQAVTLARRALALQPEFQRYFWDTLAAAYAETGNFEEAIVAQQHALVLIEAAGDHEEWAAYQHRLELYKTHQPYRQ